MTKYEPRRSGVVSFLRKRVDMTYATIAVPTTGETLSYLGDSSPLFSISTANDGQRWTTTLFLSQHLLATKTCLIMLCPRTMRQNRVQARCPIGVVQFTATRYNAILLYSRSHSLSRIITLRSNLSVMLHFKTEQCTVVRIAKN